MGEVFLARDARLERMVAIKAMPAELAGDADRLARFQREAKVLASLNHPAIGAIYGLEEVAGHQYLILEYVEGETLAERRARGAIPVDEALTLARQIAEALEAAHEKGVVHRDLKPANVMVTGEGVAKVLDFGLARAPEPGTGVGAGTGSPGLPDSPTVATVARPHSPTIPGVIMGTAGYMSPEQARGRPVDKRSDIFSFGCVLYEMLTGVAPFRGETVADAIGATLHKELDLALLPAGAQGRVRDLLASCLAKDRRQRLHDIGDARLEIERALSRGGEDGVSAPAGRRAARPGLVAAAVVAVAGLVAGAWWVGARGSGAGVAAAGVVRLVIPSRTEAYSQAEGAVVAPDGRTVVFSALGAEGSRRSLWLRPIDSFEARRLPETEDADGPFWSPDGRSVAYFAEGKLWSQDVAGGSSRRLICGGGLYGSGGACWGPDGTILLSNLPGTSPIMRVPAAGGAAEAVTTLDPGTVEKGHVYPRFLPDGQHFLYVGVQFDPAVEVRQGKLYAGRLGSAERVSIGSMISAVWYVEPGSLVYVEDGTVKVVPFDAKGLKITGEPVTVADGARYFRGYGYSSLSVARDGTLVYQPPPLEQQLVWFDMTGKRLGTVGPRGRLYDVRISPDGAQAAVSVGDRRTGYSDLWLFGLARASTVHLTTDAREESTPVWSRDGSRIYYSADRAMTPEIQTVGSDGSGPTEAFYGQGAQGMVWHAMDISPDGRDMIMSGVVEKRGQELLVMPVDRSTKPVAFRSTPAGEGDARFSPDGKWVAYAADESGTAEVYLSAYPEKGPKVQVSSGGGLSPLWSKDGTKLYYGRLAGAGVASAIMVVEFASAGDFAAPPRPRVQFEVPEMLTGGDISPDGERLLLICSPRETPGIHVVQHAVRGR